MPGLQQDQSALSARHLTTTQPTHIQLLESCAERKWESLWSQILCFGERSDAALVTKNAEKKYCCFLWCPKPKWFNSSAMYSVRILATVSLNTECIIHEFLNSHSFTLFMENKWWNKTSLTFSLLSLYVYLLSISILHTSPSTYISIQNFLFLFHFFFFFSNLFALFAFHPFHTRFCFSFSLVLGRLFELIFALLLTNFLILFLLLMSLSHAFLPFLFFFPF